MCPLTRSSARHSCCPYSVTRRYAGCVRLHGEARNVSVDRTALRDGTQDVSTHTEQCETFLLTVQRYETLCGMFPHTRRRVRRCIKNYNGKKQRRMHLNFWRRTGEDKYCPKRRRRSPVLNEAVWEGINNFSGAVQPRRGKSLRKKA